jgi:hypothetical protein
MKPELQSRVEDITKALGISAHAKGTIMEVELNWDQLDQFFRDMYSVTAIRHRSIMGSITIEQWVTVYRSALVKRIQYVRESVLGQSDGKYPRVRLSKAMVIHGAAHTIFAHIGLFKSEDLGLRFIPKLPPKEWATVDQEALLAHADVIEGLRSRGLVVSEGFPSEFTGTMAFFLMVKDLADEMGSMASAPTKEATPNDGMMASVVFRTRTALTLGYGYDFSPVATPNVVQRRLLGAYMGGVHEFED